MKYKNFSFQAFVNKKKIYWKKKEYVWVYLEREMRENIEQKPYNEVVGEWLRFLRDMKLYFMEEEKKKYKRLVKEAGPAWFIEFSSKQRELVKTLRESVHQDTVECTTKRVRRDIKELGVYAKLNNDIFLKALKNADDDAGCFLWHLYKEIYKSPPCFLKHSYDLNAMLLMSAMVFIDLDDTYQLLDEVIGPTRWPPKPEKPKPPKYWEPKNIRYGMYLQKMYVPLYCHHPSVDELTRSKNSPIIDTKIKLRRIESYEALLKDTSFLEKRIERNKAEKEMARPCTYKFWEPPAGARVTNPKMRKYLVKLRMIKLKASKKFLKYKPPLEKEQFHIGTVAFISEKPVYQLHSIVQLPSGYIPLNEGVVIITTGEHVTHIGGYWLYPRQTKVSCDEKCDCMKWEDDVMKYLHESKCKCCHYYDYYHETKCTDKFFRPPTGFFPHSFDYAKIYQMDPTEDFIKDKVEEALECSEASVVKSRHKLDAAGLKDSDLLRAFLAELADTHLIVPHLPEAHHLYNLQAWVRKKVKGPISEKLHKKWKLKTQRRCLELDHVDFRARAYFIPFTKKELKQFSYIHRRLVQKMYKYFLNDFVLRNQIKQVEQARLMWSTTRNDYYSKEGNTSFRDLYFTYMPSRVQDTYLINPYNPNTKHGGGGKACPLN